MYSELLNHKVNIIGFLRKLFVGVVIVALVIFLSSNFLDIQTLWQNIKAIPLYIYFIILSLSFLSYLFRAIRWLNFMRNVEPNLSFFEHFRIYFSGFALTMSPGKLGELMRARYLHRHDVPFSFCVSAFMTERIWDVLIVSILSLFYLSAFLSHWLVFCILSLPFLVIAIIHTSWLDWIISKIKKLDFLKSNIRSFRSLWGCKLNLYAVFLTLMAWSAQGVSLIFILYSMGYSEISPLVIIGIYCVSLLAGAISLLPSGIGATEASMSAILIYMGVPAEAAILATLLTRVLTFWFAILLGFIAFCQLEWQRKI